MLRRERSVERSPQTRYHRSVSREIIDYPFAEDLAAAERFDRLAEMHPRPSSDYHFRTVEELMAPLTEDSSFKELVAEEATNPRLRAAWLER